jgi:RHS repeat-associated protein
MMKRSGSTSNDYLFAGERRDTVIGLDYLRARYLNFETGRFISRDNFGGSIFRPSTLNLFLYTASDPVNSSDPSGHWTLTDVLSAQTIQNILTTIRGIRAGTTICRLAGGIRTLSEIVSFTALTGILFSALSATSYASFYKAGGTAVRVENKGGTITAIEVRYFVSGGVPILGVAIDFKDAPRFRVNYNFRDGKLDAQLGLSTNVYKLKLCGIEIANFDLAVRSDFSTFPYSTKLGLDANLLKLARVQITLFDTNWLGGGKAEVNPY